MPAPKGNLNAKTHGLVTLRNALRRRRKRGRSAIDQRTREGQDALQLQARLIEDQGGMEAITATALIAINGLTYNVWFRSMQIKDVSKVLKVQPRFKNARALARIHSYLAPVDNAITKYCALLGMDKKPAPVKTLEQILSEDAENDATGKEES